MNVQPDNTSSFFRDRAKAIDADIRQILDDFVDDEGGRKPSKVSGRPSGEFWKSEAQRIKRDVERLAVAYEAARNRAAVARTPENERIPTALVPEPASADKVASLKRVLMLVVNELV